jgi:hypothetical protein
MIVYKNILYHRGDKETVKIEYPGDISSHSLSFVLKKDRELSSSRLIEITGNLNRENEKFSAVYDENKKITLITIKPDPTDTQDISGNFVFDIYDSTDSVTRVDGNFYMEPDVQTPFDGTNLPNDGRRYVPYYPEDFKNNDVLQYDAALHEFKGITPGSLSEDIFYNKSELDGFLSVKVDKISGKGLSENDFTNEQKATYTNHLFNNANPHSTTKVQLGLGNVPNLDTTSTINNLGGINILNQTLIEWTENSAYQLLIIIRNSSGIITSATVQWPDGSAGTLTTTTINNTWLAIDAYTITHILSGKTVTQSTVTRDTNGNIITKPALAAA